MEIRKQGTTESRIRCHLAFPRKGREKKNNLQVNGERVMGRTIKISTKARNKSVLQSQGKVLFLPASDERIFYISYRSCRAHFVETSIWGSAPSTSAGVIFYWPFQGSHWNLLLPFQILRLFKCERLLRYK